jgi:hypothetical protein
MKNINDKAKFISISPVPSMLKILRKNLKEGDYWLGDNELKKNLVIQI